MKNWQDYAIDLNTSKPIGGEDIYQKHQPTFKSNKKARTPSKKPTPQYAKTLIFADFLVFLLSTCFIFLNFSILFNYSNSINFYYDHRILLNITIFFGLPISIILTIITALYIIFKTKNKKGLRPYRTLSKYIILAILIGIGITSTVYILPSDWLPARITAITGGYITFIILNILGFVKSKLPVLMV